MSVTKKKSCQEVKKQKKLLQSELQPYSPEGHLGSQLTLQL